VPDEILAEGAADTNRSNSRVFSHEFTAVGPMPLSYSIVIRRSANARSTRSVNCGRTRV
jgi:hypothetical protein